MTNLTAEALHALHDALHAGADQAHRVEEALATLLGDTTPADTTPAGHTAVSDDPTVVKGSE